MAEKCKECGCECACCTQDEQQNSDMHLHVEIENLRQRLLERDNHIVTMETQFLNEADKFPNGELASIKEEIVMWQEKYSRLHEAHKRVQKVNQNLEDKLLRIVDKCETEKSAFTKDIATLSHRLADANYTIHRLTQDNEKYRNDVNLAIQLLQCKPSNFVGQKYDSLPSEVQAKVRTYVAQKRRSSDTSPPDVKSITVPISTFPPTAMVYNVTKPNLEKHSDDDTDDSKPPVDVVSAAIMAKVLEDREKERIFAKHCDTCTCHKSILMVDAETQTNDTNNTYTCNMCNGCISRCSPNIDRFVDSYKSTDNAGHGKDNQNFIVHSVHQEINENAINNGKTQLYNNRGCLKQSNCQSLCAKDKMTTRISKSLDASREEIRSSIGTKTNLNKKNSVRRADMPIQTVSSNYSNSNSNINKQNTSQNLGDISMAKLNIDKIKQSRCNKKTDSHVDIKSNATYWSKFERKCSFNNNAVGENSVTKERSQIEIINDRLWKNEWTKMKPELNTRDDKKRSSSDMEIDVINDRVWKNNKSWTEVRNPTHLTLIEVKNVDSATTESDSKQTEVATSPSYSSDSVVISTSDPSSSSSDVVQSQTGMQLTHNGTNSKSSTQNRITGPRNCLVRVTPGSKNILLDNVGQYKTVLYTSGNNKSNTALVHIKKSARSDSERSTSTCSEDNSPALMHNENQLQRVAEWVQSSVGMDKNQQSNEKVSKHVRDTVDLQHGAPGNYDKNKFNVISQENEEIKQEQLLGDIADFTKKQNSDLNVSSSSSNVNCNTADKEKDLITFDVPSEDEKPQSNNKINSSDFNYEVKITKEMEETYLKLAASLDPVALNLPGSETMDLTIEKYRKDYKKIHGQRVQDKAGSTT